MTRDDWTLRFQRRLRELRPHLSVKVATAVAAQQWPKCRALDPENAAAAWHEAASAAIVPPDVPT